MISSCGHIKALLPSKARCCVRSLAWPRAHVDLAANGSARSVMAVAISGETPSHVF